MTRNSLTMLLIPGAWMGGWIWANTIEQLRLAGCTAHTLTLSGLDGNATPDELALVHLADHVSDAVSAVRALDEPVMIVGHSYSGLIAGMVADQAPDQVVHTAIIAGFFPRDGMSMLDDWGDNQQERAAERADIEQAGMIWAPPPAEGIRADAGLTPDDARWLGERLTPHPGRTVLEPATMRRPITEQSVTVIADVGDGDPRASLPADLVDAELSRWSFRALPAGHWPMLSFPDRLQDALMEAAVDAASQA